MKRPLKHPINWKAVLTALLITGLVWAAWMYLGPRTNQSILLRNLESKNTELDHKLEELHKSNLTTQQLQEQTKTLETQKADLEKQLQAKKDNANKVYAESLVQAPVAVSVPKAVSSVVAGCGDNADANFIYSHESGCSLWNPNSSSGACGLGQAYPCSKLTAVCPNLDYACENSFFNNYALARYGSWSNAAAYWRAHSNW